MPPPSTPAPAPELSAILFIFERPWGIEVARGGEGRKTAAGKGHILRDDGGGLGNGQGTTYGARAGGGRW